MDLKLTKNRYRQTKQWSSIMNSLLVPENIPLDFAKKINISLCSGRVITVGSKKAFQKQMDVLVESEEEIDDITLELNYQKLIDLVEEKTVKLFSNIN